MAMIEINPDIEQNLRKQDVKKYLLLHGWQQVEHPNKRMQVFDGELDDEGKPIRAVLSITEELKDTTLRIYQAVQTIAGGEDRSIAAVAADIQKLHGDNAATKTDEALSGK
jgi:O6-methylguanine-DNA--protein-cysteine methyltransferase